MSNKMEALERSFARIWNMPEVMVRDIEGPRRPFPGPLAKIAGETVIIQTPTEAVVYKIVEIS